MLASRQKKLERAILPFKPFLKAIETATLTQSDNLKELEEKLSAQARALVSEDRHAVRVGELGRAVLLAILLVRPEELRLARRAAMVGRRRLAQEQEDGEEGGFGHFGLLDREDRSVSTVWGQEAGE